MATLVDSGILLRLFVSADPASASIRDALIRLRTQQEVLQTTFQNIAEFWNVSTRPISARGGFGLLPDVVEARVRFLERRFHVLVESPASYLAWREIVKKHSLQGVAVHDARLAAVMLCAKIDRVLTLNPADFQRYAGDGILAVTPADVCATG